MRHVRSSLTLTERARTSRAHRLPMAGRSTSPFAHRPCLTAAYAPWPGPGLAFDEISNRVDIDCEQLHGGRRAKTGDAVGTGKILCKGLFRAQRTRELGRIKALDLESATGQLKRFLNHRPSFFNP